MHGILINEQKEQDDREMISDYLTRGGEETKRAFWMGMGLRGDRLPDFRSNTQGTIVDADKVYDEILQTALVRCWLVAPAELKDTEEYVKLAARFHDKRLDWGMRMSMQIPPLVYSACIGLSGDRDFWRGERAIKALVRNFPGAKAKYETAIYGAPRPQVTA